jgi:hypothetical protein
LRKKAYQNAADWSRRGQYPFISGRRRLPVQRRRRIEGQYLLKHGLPKQDLQKIGEKVVNCQRSGTGLHWRGERNRIILPLPRPCETVGDPTATINKRRRIWFECPPTPDLRSRPASNDLKRTPA